jgi:hypothetical protein
MPVLPLMHREATVPISFFIDSPAHLVRTTCVGRITRTEIVAYIQELVSQGVFELAQLIDGRAATLTLTPDDTREIAALAGALRATYHAAPVAFVAGDATSYEVAALYADVGAGSNPHYQVFEEVIAAELWIAISGDAND